jgi:hypothetical protein
LFYFDVDFPEPDFNQMGLLYRASSQLDIQTLQLPAISVNYTLSLLNGAIDKYLYGNNQLNHLKIIL